VTCYKRTGRWEAHIWDGGKQVHLGSFADDVDAAKAYDRAALLLRGINADINFSSCQYANDPALKYLRRFQQSSNTKLSKDDIIKHLRLFQKEHQKRQQQMKNDNDLNMAAERKKMIQASKNSVIDRKYILSNPGGTEGGFRPIFMKTATPTNKT